MKILVLLLLLMSAYAAQAQQIGMPVRVSEAGGNATSPCIRVMPNGNVYATWFSGTVSIHFARSTDGGQTFAPSTIASTAVTSNSYDAMFQRSPEFAVDTKGGIHVVWTEDRINSQNDVWYVRSNNNGKTWTKPVSIMDADDSAKYSQDFAAIAIDSSDHLYVTFLDDRELVRKRSTNMQLLMLKSMDGGNTWSKSFKASNMPGGKGGTCECCKQEIVSSPEGHLYSAFRSNINNIRDIYIARSMNGGDSWDTAIKAQLGDWTINACPTTGPNILLDAKENLHLVWKDARDASKRSIAYYTLLLKNASKVLPNIPISRKTNQSANWPSLSLGKDGVLLAAYQIGSGGGQQIRYTISRDGGSTWSLDTAINSSMDDQQLADLELTPNGKFLLGWMNSPSAGGSDIMLSAFTSLPSSVAPMPAQILAPDSVASQKTVTALRWTSPGKSIVWYDATLTGPMTMNSALALLDTTWQLPMLANGVYNYTITSHTVTGQATTLGHFTIASASVASNAIDRSFELYPNPVSTGSGRLHLKFEDADAHDVTIFDALGRTALKARVGESSSELNVRSLRPGLYTCRIQSGLKTSSTNFVVR